MSDRTQEVWRGSGVDGRPRIVVVGGGVAGLAAATRAATLGARVTLLERAERVGGRALSREHAGFQFNMGPHALYPQARARLASLGVEVSGGVPGDYLAVDGDATRRLPVDIRTLVTTRLLGPREKLDAARAMTALMKGDPAALAGIPLSEWIAEHARAPRMRRLIEAVARLATYVDAPELLSTGALVAQARSGSVLYVDGGWRAIVDGLRERACATGVELRGRARVEGVVHEGRARGVRLAGGEVLDADAVVLAIAPDEAAALVPADAALARAAAEAVPVEATWIDLALSARPVGARAFGLGIDRPLYYSEHSRWARLAPTSGAAVVVARYLRPGDATSPDERRASLEAFADHLAAGWRDALVEARFFPGMTVMRALPLASRGGLPGRPDVDAAGVAGVFVAGDWVRAEQLLGDGALETALRAAEGAVTVARQGASMAAR